MTVGYSSYCCELFYPSICLARFYAEEEIIISILILGHTDYAKIIRYSISFIFATFFAFQDTMHASNSIEAFSRNIFVSRVA